jgi:hypothetical protein
MNFPLRVMWTMRVMLLLLVTAAVAYADLPDPQLMRPVLLQDDAACAIFARCPTRKVLPEEDLAQAGDLLRADRVELAAARGEREQVQLVLRPAETLAGLDLRFSALSGPGRIPAEAWSWDRVAYTNVRRGSYHYGLSTNQRGLLPDPLEPAGAFGAPAASNTTLLLTRVLRQRDRGGWRIRGDRACRADGVGDHDARGPPAGELRHRGRSGSRGVPCDAGA